LIIPSFCGLPGVQAVFQPKKERRFEGVQNSTQGF